MKREILLTVNLILGLSLFAQKEETISIQEAIKQKMIQVNGQYNENSVHYLRPVVLAIINLIQRPLQLKIESGQFMEPDDSSCQAMMITGDTLLVINPGQKTMIEPFGMCTEPGDKAGSPGLSYSLQINKDTKLTAIAKFINLHKLNDYPGQEAVWCVADSDRSLLDINGYDSINRLKLIKEVASITGKKMPAPIEITQGYDNYTSVPTETIEFSFEFKSSKIRKVHIALFNSLGTVVRELYYNPIEQPGVHKVNFEFDYTAFTDVFYDIKLIADNEILMTSRIDKNYRDWEEEGDE